MGLTGAWEQAPPRLQRAVRAIGELREQGLYFVPIRHHSPACAIAVRSLIEQVHPTTLLVEGPQEYTALVPTLLDPATRPPVAILSVDDRQQTSGFYPLADFSPEWVAISAADELGARIEFIDRPWCERADVPGANPGSGERPGSGETPGSGESPPAGGGLSGDLSTGPGTLPDAATRTDDAVARTLQAERYLAHSRTMNALASRLGCRDHDELWEHLIETRTTTGLTDWRTVADDVLAWAGLARLDYEDAVLEADGTLDREARMSARIADRRGEGATVVVTGAFHTLALVEALTGAPEGAAVVARRPKAGYGAMASGTSWLIRYDHDRLDGLRGYGAGMPSPGYHQRVWESRRSGGTGDVAAAFFVDVARRAADLGAPAGVANTSAALGQARRLADLRGRAVPGRTDILDALTSCFVKDDGAMPAPMSQALSAELGGAVLGELPPGTAAPPLVTEARDRAVALRLSVADSTSHVVTLDPRRKPRHRERRRFLQLMAFIGSGFARNLTSGSVAAAAGGGRLLEEWQYAWTPMVEAALIESSSRGATLEDVAVSLLRERERQVVEARRSSAVATLLAQAASMGMHDEEGRLVVVLRATFDADPDLASVVAASHAVIGLWRARRELELSDAAAFLELVGFGIAAASYLAPDLAHVEEPEETAAIETLISLRELLRGVRTAARTAAAMAPDSAITIADTDSDATPDLAEPVARELMRIRDDVGAAPGVRGALIAMDAVTGPEGIAMLVAAVQAHMSPGASAPAAVRFLQGMMRAASDLLVHTPDLFEGVHVGLREMTAADFRALLPDLRRAFTQLKPAETARLAEQVAVRTGMRATDIDVVIAVSGADLAAAIAVEHDLVATLERDGLGGWAWSADRRRATDGQNSPPAAGRLAGASDVAAFDAGTPGAEAASVTTPGAEREAARRWRLVLGRYADRSLPPAADDAQTEAALSFLYDREYTARGLRLGPGAPKRGSSGGRAGGLDRTVIQSVEWLGRARSLFPRETFERMQGDALTRYGMTELLSPESAESLDAAPELVTALLQIRGRLDERTEAGLRIIITKTVEEIVARLRPRFLTALSGRRNRMHRSPRPRSQDFDWQRTIRANLAKYDVESQRLLIADVRFTARSRRALTWDVIVLVDQSGSMAPSLLYSAVCAGILSGLPGIRVRLLLFDTSVVDLSALAADPVAVLMTAQLGGGTDIAGALGHAEKLVTTPSRTVVVVVSDFEEGGSVSALLATTRRMSTAGTCMLGLAALDEGAQPRYDRGVAQRLADRGMEVAALTPSHFAQWLGEVLI